MRVLQLNKLYAPWIGGVEKVVQNIAEGLKANVEMDVVVCQPRGRGRRERVNGVRVTRATSLGVVWGMPISPTYPFLLARQSRGADIVHAHCPFPLGVMAYLTFGSRRAKLVVTYHSDIVRQRRLMRFYGLFLRRFLSRADAIMVTSPHMLEASPHLAPHRDKCRVVPLSVDLAETGQPPAQSYDLGLPTDDRIVLFAGRLSYYKGLNYLLEAMRDVDATLVIAGDGEERDALSSQVEEIGVTDKALFLGRLSDDELKYCYQHCDLFVLPSVEPSEAFGIVQLEAMAYGKPVVNTSLPTGVPYVSVHGETGLTVPPQDADALAEAINAILDDPDRAERYGRNARRRVEQVFSREAMLASVYEVYRGVMSG
ncbi:MAG: glycosyltransferase [Salinibacter sp.]